MTTTTTRKPRRAHGGAGHPVAAKTDEPQSLGRRARKLYHDVRHGSFTCCGKEWHSARYLNAHHASTHAGRWSGKAARAAGRKMGKGVDDGRRWALGVLEGAGLRTWKKVPVRGKDGKVVERNGRTVTRDVPVKTARAESRPVVRGRVSARQLRELHRHDTDHESAESRRLKAAGHTARIDRGARTPVGRAVHRVRSARAETHTRKADTLEARWNPGRIPAAPAPRQAPAARSSNGHTPEPGRAPGTRPGRTRTPR